MSKKIEIHAVVELENNAINRGRDGFLKKTVDAYGVTHQYISRQCVNREVRENKINESSNRQGLKVTRKEMEDLIHTELANIGLTDATKIEKIVNGVLDIYGLKKKEKSTGNQKPSKKKNDAENAEETAESDTSNGTNTENVDNLVVFLSLREVERIVKALSENDWEAIGEDESTNNAKNTKKDKNTKIKNVVQKVRNELQMSEDVGMFGRMIASNPWLNVRGAVSGTDLTSVTKMNSVYDFYTSNSTGNGEGATNMGNIEMNSGVFYQTTILEYETLCENIKDEETIHRMFSWDYLKDFVECVGTGHQHGKFCRTRPTYIAVVVTEGNAQTIRRSALYGKKSIEEIVNALHDELVDRINDPNCVSDKAKMAEDNKITKKHDNFNEFIKSSLFEK